MRSRKSGLWFLKDYCEMKEKEMRNERKKEEEKELYEDYWKECRIVYGNERGKRRKKVGQRRGRRKRSVLRKGKLACPRDGISEHLISGLDAARGNFLVLGSRDILV